MPFSERVWLGQRWEPGQGMTWRSEHAVDLRTRTRSKAKASASLLEELLTEEHTARPQGSQDSRLSTDLLTSIMLPMQEQQRLTMTLVSNQLQSEPAILPRAPTPSVTKRIEYLSSSVLIRSTW